MQELKNKIEDYKQAWLLFGGKGYIVEIFEGISNQLELLQKENTLLKAELAKAPPIKDITAEDIRDKLHSLEGEKQLNGEYIQNVKENLSDKYFEKVIIDGIEVITLKPEVVKTLEFVKEGI